MPSSQRLWLRLAWAIYFLIGVIFMLPPAPKWDESPGSYSSRREQDLSDSCPCSSDPLSKAGVCFVYFSGEFDSCGLTQDSTQKQCLRKQQRSGWTDSKGSGSSRHIIVKTYSCLSETLGNLQQITDGLMRAKRLGFAFPSHSGPCWEEALEERNGPKRPPSDLHVGALFPEPHSQLWLMLGQIQLTSGSRAGSNL